MMAAKCLDVSDPANRFAHKLYYVQDGLYSRRALVSTKFVISEQTGYDVYGRPVTWTSGDADADRDIDAADQGLLTASYNKGECDADYNWRCDVDNSGWVNILDLAAFRTVRLSSTPANQQSFFTNPYYFTGRRIDLLDDGNLPLQYNRHRYYDYYTGRWTTHDPLGIMPNARRPNRFTPLGQYDDSLSLYDYANGNPVIYVDFMGLLLIPRVNPRVPPGWYQGYDWWNPVSPSGEVVCEKPCKWRNDGDATRRYSEGGCVRSSVTLPIGGAVGATIAIGGIVWEVLSPTAEHCSGPLVEGFTCQCSLVIKRSCKRKCCNRWRGVWTDKSGVSVIVQKRTRAVWDQFLGTYCPCNPRSVWISWSPAMLQAHTNAAVDCDELN